MLWLFILIPLFGAFADEAPSSLREIIGKYGNTDKDTLHSYVESYESLLYLFQDRPCSLLEIGVNHGGSAIMWYEYLPESKLFLLDTRNAISPHIAAAMNLDRVQLYIGDAYTDGMVSRMYHDCPNGFDIIIDDGPHTLASQIYVLTSYLPLLNPGGILVIEDIQDISHVEILRQYVADEVDVIDLRAVKGRYDDILFVVKKKMNLIPALKLL